MTKYFCTLVATTLLASAGPSAMADTNQSVAARWLENSPPVPEFSAPASPMAWELQRKKIHSELKQLLGKFPARAESPVVKTLTREERNGYTLEKFEFDDGLGATVPGYLLLPKKTNAKSPAILYCHWHGGEYEIGKEEVFLSKHTPVPPGPALAERGYVVMAIDACCFGERNGRGPGGPSEKGGAGEMTASKFNLWVGRTLWGMLLHDDQMALDSLAHRPEVDPQRIGVMGMSLGATRTWWLMALDERLKTGVAIDCLTRYQNLIQQEGLKAHGIYYFVPNLLNHFDTEAIVALIAPRPVLFLDGDQDGTSPVDGIHVIEAKVRPVYHLYKKEDAFQSIVYPNQGHVYTQEMWDKTLKWFEEKL